MATWSDVLPIVALLLYPIVAFLVYRLRIRKGRSVVARHSNGESVFRTDLGRFTVTRDRLIVESVRGSRRDVPLAEIRGLRYSHSTRPAFEELIYGLDLSDLSARWRDRIEWYAIAVVTTGDDVPMFIAGQLERRGPYMQWWFDWTERTLAALHLYNDVETRALSVLNQLRAAFRAAGRTLPLV